MGLVYLAALALGGGFLAVQLLLASSDAGDGGIDHDLGDAGGAGDVDHDVGSGGSHAGGWFSPRFVTFALFAFGFAGAGLHFLGLAPAAVTLGLAVAAGLGSGFLASAVFRALRRKEATSSAALEEAAGTMGTLLLPAAPDRPGKVRVTLKGQLVDLVAVPEDGPVPAGTQVVVLEVRDDVARVVRAPEGNES